jgi:hypothetical protein
VIKRLLASIPTADDGTLIESYRAHEAKTAAIISREDVWHSVGRIAAALLATGLVHDAEARTMISPTVFSGAYAIRNPQSAETA